MGLTKPVFSKGTPPTATSVAATKDGKRIASAGKNEIHVWDVESGKLVLALRDPFTVHRVALSPDGALLAAANAGGQVTVWDAVTGKRLRTIEAHQGHALAAAFHPQLPRLMTVGRDQWAKEWDVTSGVMVRAFRNHLHGALSVAYRADGNQVAVGGSEGMTCLWDLRPHDGAHATWKAPSVALGVTFRDRRAAAGGDGVVAVFDFAEKRSLASHRQHADLVHGVALSPDGERVVSGSQDGTIVVWDVSKNRLVRTLKDPGAKATSGVHCIAHHPREPLIAAGDLDKNIRLWDLAAGKRLAVSGHANVLTSVAFDPDGKRLASTSIDGDVRVWDLATHECRHTLRTEGMARRAVWSRDGRFLAGCGNQAVTIWDFAQPEQPRLTLVGHTAPILDAAFHPDGKRLATTGEDLTVRLWDLETGQEVLTLSGHRGEVYGVAFSDDGAALLSGSSDGVVKLWQAQRP